MESGGDLLSRTVTSQVPSALKGLTSVFGMGTGGTPSSLPPEMVSCKSETAFHSVFRLPVPRFRKFRPSDRPFLPPSGLKVFLRNLNRRNSAPRSLLVSVDLTSDEIPSTGGHQRFATLTTAQYRFSVKTVNQLISESRFCNQALDRLVSSSCMRYRTSTDDLSTR